MRMYHCREPMARRRDPPGWFCVKCKIFEPDVVKERMKILPQDEFDMNLSDKKTIAIIVASAIFSAAAIFVWVLFIAR